MYWRMYQRDDDYGVNDLMWCMMIGFTIQFDMQMNKVSTFIMADINDDDLRCIDTSIKEVYPYSECFDAWILDTWYILSGYFYDIS